MIVCKLEDASGYAGLHPLFDKAFAWLKSRDFTQMTPGREDIEGTDLYALIQTYETAAPADKKWETHEKYLDIQYVVAGSEACGWAAAGTLAPLDAYNPEKDIRFYRDAAGTSTIHLHAGELAILMPEDIHRPGCRADGAEQVVKVVLKVRLQA